MEKGTYTALVALFALILFIGVISLNEINATNFENNLLIMRAADLKATIMQLQLSFDKALTKALANAVEERFLEDNNCSLPENVNYYIEALFSDITREVNQKQNVLCSYRIENNFQNSMPMKVEINCTFTALKQQKLWFNINSNNKFELGKEVILNKTADGCEIRIRDLHTMAEEYYALVKS